MAKLSRSGIIKGSKGGIRYSQLVAQILSQSPETPKNSINGAVWNLDSLYPQEIAKPTRGLFTFLSDEANKPLFEDTSKKFKEEDFYEPFAEWLKTDLDEATDATSLGGAGMQKKWGTPDVVGVYKPLASNLIKFGIEIISAEIKIDRNQPVVAFGQAMAYRLFSTKTYVVMPSTMTEEDASRLETLCMLFGAGLVLFELDLNNPNFTIRVRAQRFSPDMFYVNEFADRLKVMDHDRFEKLFR